MRFEFTTAAKILFGPGTAREVPALAHSMGRRALVIGGRSAERTSGLIRGLQEQAVETVTFSVSREPTTEIVLEGLALARAQGCDLVIEPPTLRRSLAKVEPVMLPLFDTRPWESRETGWD